MDRFVDSIASLTYANAIRLGGVAVCGFLFSFVLVAYCMHDKDDKSHQMKFKIKFNPPTKDALRARQHRMVCIKYGGQYYEELENLGERDLDESELNNLLDCAIDEDTPDGKVIMRYNHGLRVYEYYTDNKNIPNRILDALCRKYATTYDCKMICVNHRREIQRVREKFLKEKPDNVEVIPENKVVHSKDSIFVNSEPARKKKRVVLDNMNRFKYNGKLADYTKNNRGNKEDKHSKKSNLTFSEYKRLLKSEENAAAWGEM
jgi:hypothetical protein